MNFENNLKYELHIHTYEGSACAVSSGAAMAEHYKKYGYTGIFTTDHFFNGSCRPSQRLKWSDWVNEFCRGYENAKKRGDEIGLDVFFAWEFSYQGSDFLTYGLDKHWLLENPQVVNLDICDYLDFIHQNGGFVIHAHPFRERNYIKKMTLVPFEVDAVEVINGGHRPEESIFNKRAKAYAESYGLPFTVGSDAHSADSPPATALITNTRIESSNNLFEIIRNGNYILSPDISEI